MNRCYWTKRSRTIGRTTVGGDGACHNLAHFSLFMINYDRRVFHAPVAVDSSTLCRCHDLLSHQAAGFRPPPCSHGFHFPIHD
jgi:hypothetical protein